MQYHSPLCSLPWLELSGQSAFQSWNVSVSEQCWSVIALPSLMWYLEVRSKRCSIPAAGSFLNSSDPEAPCDGAISKVLNKKNIRGSRWNPVVCFRSAPLKLPSSPPVPARWKLCHVSVHPRAASSNCTAVIPSGAVKFHQCAAGGKLGWGNYLAQSASSVLSDLMGKKFVQLRAQLRSNRIFRLFKPSFGFWPCHCSVAIWMV